MCTRDVLGPGARRWVPGTQGGHTGTGRDRREGHGPGESSEGHGPPNQGFPRLGRGEGLQESLTLALALFWNQQIMYMFWLFCAK